MSVNAQYYNIKDPPHTSILKKFTFWYEKGLRFYLREKSIRSHLFRFLTTQNFFRVQIAGMIFQTGSKAHLKKGHDPQSSHVLMYL